MEALNLAMTLLCPSCNYQMAFSPYKNGGKMVGVACVTTGCDQKGVEYEVVLPTVPLLKKEANNGEA